MENGLKAENGEKMENQMENRPELDRGKMAKKMAQEWIFEEFSIFSPFSLHFFAIFAPVKLGAVFHFFAISGFQAVFHSVQARQNPKSRNLWVIKFGGSFFTYGWSFFAYS